MPISRSKIVIVGTGSVGAAVAFNLAINHTCDDLVLIDRNKKKAWAEAKDLQHSLGYRGIRMNVTDGDYADCGDADLVVIAAALPYVMGQTRLDQVEQAAEVVRSIVTPVMESGFQGMFVVITNPVDIMTYCVQKWSGLPDSRVIGTGTALDSARLKYHLSETMNVDPQSVYALCMGEHGDSQMVPWSQVTVGGKRFLDILKDNPDRFPGFNVNDMGKHIMQVAYDIVMAKGATTFGIAATTVQIIQAILRDENKVIPVSAMLHGEYGESGVYAGIPAVINNQGVKELVELHLTVEERQALSDSVKLIRGYCEKVVIEPTNR
ncbi:L-lactate dehydrogenase [Gorillibacterium timonense]|uniref:L-lactate dehydrogenase n=1 Tax=Gorillibacterium timonense TaxID=1689269 RepID=UPI00071D1FF0|nr:L-lactate dehydrogenase [Gorillibacterium timonense]